MRAAISSVGAIWQRVLKPGKKRLAAFATALVATTGCTSVSEYVQNGYKVGPNYCRPPAPLAQHWIDEADKRVRQDTADTSRWWAAFNDPALDTLIQRAAQENLSLREAGFRVLEARARRGIAAGNLFPQTQQLDASYSRNKISENVNSQFFVPKQWFNLNEGGFNLAWELDFWGRFRRAVEAADAELDASIENYDDVMVLLLADVATAYVQYRTLETRLVVARANVVLLTETRTIADARFKAGTATKIDYDQAESDLASVQATIPTLEAQQRFAQNQLCILLGMPPRDLTAELGKGQIPNCSASVAIGIPAELLTRRPDLRRAEREAAAQSALIGVAVSDLYPHIAVTGTVGLQANEFGQLFKGEPSMVGSVGPSMQWNVLNYGRLLNNVRLQDARFQELVTRYQNRVLQAGSEVEDALVAFLKAQATAEALARSVFASADGVRLAAVQYREGRIPFVVVANLQENLVQRQDQLAVAMGAIPGALIQVYRALGGGWQIRLADPNAPAPAAEPITDPAAPSYETLKPVDIMPTPAKK